VTGEALSLALEAFGPHLAALALIAARLVPVAFLCPLFGGAQAPSHVKLGLVLSLSLYFHFGAGLGAAPADGLTLAVLAGREALLGVALGLVAAVPFDAARIGGRFIDLFRGSSAEAALPMAGSREAASGEFLYHLLLGLACAAGALPVLVASLGRSYLLLPPGGAVGAEPLAEGVVTAVGVAFGTGLSIGAPIAGLALLVDLGVGLAARGAPQLSLQETGTPLRIVGGAAALWLGLGLLCERLLAVAAEQEPMLDALLRLATS
jgi:flagellar biosynthetic protein FliR/type III secretion protein T